MEHTSEPVLKSQPQPEPQLQPEPEPEQPPEPSGADVLAAADTAGVAALSVAFAQRLEEVALLKARLAATEAKLAAADDQLRHWRAAAQEFTHASCFDPRTCQYFQETLTEVLTSSLLEVEGVEAVRWVSCSMPSVPAHAPRMDLVRWTGLSESLWDVIWAPPWTVEVCVDGTNGWVSCTALLKLRGLSLRGLLALAFTPALTEATVAFASVPTIDLDVDCTVRWGALPVGGPIGDSLERAIEDMVRPSLMQVVQERWVAPNTQTVSLSDTGLWEVFENESVKRATEAAEAASKRLAAELG